MRWRIQRYVLFRRVRLHRAKLHRVTFLTPMDGRPHFWCYTCHKGLGAVPE